MDRVFSVDDISDQFWSPPPIPIRLGEDDESGSGSGSGSSSTNNNKNNNSCSSTSSKMMNRSSSEWAFQRFLQEASASNHSPPPPPPPPPARPHNDVVEIKDNNNNNNNNNPKATPTSSSHNNNQGNVEVKAASTTSFPAPPSTPPNVPVDSEEYQAFLKSRLDLACAAAALTMANCVKPREAADNASQGSSTAQLGSQVASKVVGIGLDPVNGQHKVVGGPLGIPSLPAVQNKSGVQVRSATSGSSRDDSDEDEGDEETEATQNMDPGDAKKMRRMISNRESARRSRRRKQAHLTELETQVSQMRVENSSLLKRLTDVSTKYNEAAVDNRVLKADVETLRAKVKMAEETVKRVTGLSPLFQAMSEISTIGMPSYAASPSDTSADAAVPVQDDPKQHYYQPPSGNHLPAHDPRIQNGMLEIPSVDNNVCQNPATAAAPGTKIGRTSSMQRVASLEHLQKRIRGDVSSRGNQGNGDQ